MLDERGAVFSWKRNAAVYRPSTNIRHSRPLTNSGNGSVPSVTFVRPVISISLRRFFLSNLRQVFRGSCRPKAVCERAHFVEDQGAALFNPLQHSGVFDDDGRRAASEIAPIIAVGIASSSGHGVAITTTARDRLRLAAQQRCCSCYTQGNWRLPCAQLVSQPAQLRLLLLRFVHHFYDSRVPRIFR